MPYDGKGSEKIEDMSNIHNIAYIIFYTTHAHVQQNLLYLYTFVYSLHDDGYIEAEKCRGDTINEKRLIIIDCAVCWLEYSIFNLLHVIWIPVN